MCKDNAADAIFAKIFWLGTIIVYRYTNNVFHNCSILGKTGLAGMRARFFVLLGNCGTIFDGYIAEIHLFFIVDLWKERGAQGCAPVRFFISQNRRFCKT